LTRSASKFPQNIAIRFQGYSIAYGKLEELSNRFASALTSLGVGKDTKVALLLPNCPQFAISFYGALKAGAVVVPSNPTYKERELEHQLSNSESKVLVAASNIDGNELFDIVKNVKSKTKLRHVITTSLTDFLPPFKRQFATLKGVKKIRYPNTLDFKTLLGKAKSKAPSISVRAKDDIAVLQYTGGTTGMAKGAMLSHFNLTCNAIMISKWLPIIETDVNLAVLPFSHIYGLTVALNAPLVVGASIIMLPKFNADSVLKTCTKERVSVFCGVPTMYSAILNNPNVGKYDLKSIRRCISGAAPLPLPIMQQFNQLTGGKLVEGYGLTETSPVTHCNPLDVEGMIKPGSIGIPFPDTDARVVDLETGTREREPGEVGELAIKGPQVMKGYWNNPEETIRIFRESWLLTGDITKMDSDGYFFIVDRKKDMINVSGLKVWPREVEDTLSEHPGVLEAGVIGVPDHYRGEVVKAFVVLKTDHVGKVSVQDLIEFCKSKLAEYKAPRIIEFKTELPRTLIGKVLRRSLRETEGKAITSPSR
ncbi:MAG: long-chain fatty acid--CoA ligase, partial [Candidatus Bathyarchaeia archaeon]